MIREIAMAQAMGSLSSGVGLTCDMGKDGRSEMDIGNNWTEHERPDGKKFYTNKSGKRTWTRPVEEGVMPETDFDKCKPYVNKMRYEGRYPTGVETQANDGYDCNSFLDRLYDMNEKKWEKESGAMTAQADRKLFDSVGKPLAQPTGMANMPSGVQIPAENHFVPKPASA